MQALHCKLLQSRQCELALTGLKTLLTTAPVLAFPDFKKILLLETDASILGLGAVLAQKQEDGTVMYASRTLQLHEKTMASLSWRGWLLSGHPCEVYTDHEALKSLLNTTQPSGKLARWGMAIQELEIKILHHSGCHNGNADALSRCPLPCASEPTSVEDSSGTDSVSILYAGWDPVPFLWVDHLTVLVWILSNFHNPAAAISMPWTTSPSGPKCMQCLISQLPQLPHCWWNGSSVDMECHRRFSQTDPVWSH
jgi:hypothetical protein